jgi:choline dehydrogenase-like flavoprotein
MLYTPEDIPNKLEDSADVCVIGSGAGGAVFAKEIAEGGRSVILLEEGGSYTSKDFNRNPVDMFPKLYRDMGMTTAYGLPGHPPIIVPMGKCLGGTTVINSGTCFKTPDSVLVKWAEEFGIKKCLPEDMAPFFERVEKIINVTPVTDDIMGKNGIKFREGVKKLGYSGGPIKRNMKDCKGCGTCVFGCPHDSKQAMHLTYIPSASEKGARIYTHCRVEKIKVEGSRVTGVSGTILEPGTDKPLGQFNINAKVVAVACGAMLTPVLLLRNNLANSSGEVGKNFRLHPGIRVIAVYDEVINGWLGVPQNYYVDEFFNEGIMLEGVFVPPEVGAMGMPFLGEKHKELLANYKYIGAFGAMASDTSKGRIFARGNGRPFILYNLNKEDARKLGKAVAITSKIFFAAGAKIVFPSIYGYLTLNSIDDCKKIEDANIKPSQLECMAFHPMGTCRMGSDPKKSVVDSYGESHDIKNLFIVDASIFPSSLGVNPQESIMAFSTRSAFHVLENGEQYFR